MENKKVGGLILGIGIAVGIIVWIFNYSLKEIVNSSCTHGDTCSMHTTMNAQLWLSWAIVAIILAVGLYIMYSKPRRKNNN